MELGGSKPSVEGAESGGDALTLLVAALPIEGEEALGQVREAIGEKRKRLVLVAPALTGSPLEHAMGSVDDAISEAATRLQATEEALEEKGFDVESRVGDSDPILAIEDAMREFPIELIVIVSQEGEDSRWLEGDMFERAKQKFEPPIVFVAAESSDGGTPQVTRVETDGPGADPPPEAEFDPESDNMPRFSVRDLIGIVVAVVGTLAAVVIAAGCDGGDTLQRTGPSAGQGSDGSCVAAYIVAGATALINVAHVVGLLFFESVGYRGGWARILSVSSLVGTPIAVLATILLAH